MRCIYYFYHFPKHSHHLKRKPVSTKQSLLIPLTPLHPGLAITDTLSASGHFSKCFLDISNKCSCGP